MLNRFFGDKTHTYLHLIGLSGIAIGVPLNKIAMSISMMFIVLNLLLESKFTSYFKNLKNSKSYLLILAFFLLHVIALIWSSNLDYAIHDLKGKLPLLVIPTILAAKPLENRKQLNLILGLFVLTTLLLSIINFLSYQHWIGNRLYDDIRGMSLFSSHIRFAIIISTVVAILLYFWGNWKTKKLILFLVITWFVFYTFYSQVISGLATMIAVFVTFSIYYLWQRKKWLVISIVSIATISFGILIFWIFKPITIDLDDYSNLPNTTVEGNPYTHGFDYISPETGEPIQIYFCDFELKRDWELYSKIHVDSLDRKGQPIKETIVRYLSSKRLRKDANGLAQLNSQEIKDIENGIPSVINQGILARLYGIKFQVVNVSNPNGHSLLQRLEYWKTGSQIAKNNLLIGVGTGDVQDAFNTQYEKNKSLLEEDKRRRAHNYYLTILLTFGIVGLALLLYLSFYFIRQNIQHNEIVGVLFMVVILTSYLMEDTLETQTGVTFFALFYGLFSYKNKEA